MIKKYNIEFNNYDFLTKLFENIFQLFFKEIESFLLISSFVTFWSSIWISIDILIFLNWTFESLSHNLKIFVRRQIEFEKTCVSFWEPLCTKIIGVLNLMLLSQITAIKRNFRSSPNKLKIIASIFLCKITKHFPKHFDNCTVFLNAYILSNFLKFLYWNFFQSTSS